jgi:predicted metal-dependent peptidase
MLAVQNAVVRLLKSRPFYGHLLLGLRRRIAAHGLGITINNGIPTLVVAPDEFTTFTAAEQEALLEHLLKHLLHLHPLRGKDRHSGTWDLCCDLAINPQIAGLPLGAVLPGRYRLPEGWAAEEYYRELHLPFDTGNLEGSGHGNAAEDGGTHSQTGTEEQMPTRDNASAIDDHQLWSEAESTPLRLAEEVVRRLVVQAWQQSQGEVPGELQALVGTWLAPPQLSWPQILRQFVATAGRSGRTTTWKREHRRFAHVTPGIRHQRRLNLLVAVDVSDSTNQHPLREAFARELLAISRGRDSRITVLYSGSRIQKIETFSGQQQVAEAYSGGGFTDLRPVFAHARTMATRPAAIIYLTDGYGTAPENAEFPTLWVLTADGRKPAPWGVELRLES